MKRDLYWDTLKFILIFLVIYGHVISGCHIGGQFNLTMYNFIYIFHMPLFIFISGRFSHINNRWRYKERILRLLETYIFFQLISSIIMIIKGDKLSFQYFYVPNWILWYLVSLIYWRLMVYFIPGNWLKHKGAIIALSFSISLLAGFIPIGRSLSFQKSLAYLPFFVLGYYSSEINIKSIINRISPYFALGSLLLVFAFLFVFVDENLKYIIHYNMFYWSENFVNTILNFIARGVSLSFAVVLGLMVMQLCPLNIILSKWEKLYSFIFITVFVLKFFCSKLLKISIYRISF